MTEVVRMAATAALVGDPARANMLAALMRGGALTAKELAYAAHVSAPTASGHLAKLREAGLVAAARPAPRVWKGGEALRTARTCYDHLAGRLGVAVADGMVAAGRAVLTPDGGEITPAGLDFLDAFGIDPGQGGGSRRVFCRPCLDWSERRLHLAGRVGALLCARFFELGWIVRRHDTRAVAVTPAGREGFQRSFAVPAELFAAAA